MIFGARVTTTNGTDWALVSADTREEAIAEFENDYPDVQLEDAEEIINKQYRGLAWLTREGPPPREPGK